MTLFLEAVRRVYAALLHLLPADVRRAHGAEMRDTSRQLVDDTLRRQGPFAALAAGISECADVIRAAAHASRRAPGEFRQDIKYASRLMWARPAFALTVIATLAIGIGATTTVFTVVNALLLRPLPYADPDRLVMLAALSQRNVQIALSPRDYYDITAQMPSLVSAAAFTDEQITITGGAEPERVGSAPVTWNFFDVVRAPLVLGRGFTRAEGQEGHNRVAVISHALWQRRFGGRSDVTGSTAMFDGEAYTIVGVAASSMTFPGRPQVWRPLVFTPHQLDASQRGARWISVIARLKPDVDLATADAEMQAIAARFAVDFPRTHRGRGATVRGLQPHLVQETRTGLLALLGAVALVLLIACANVANLLLARSAARTGEMTMRMALGASRGRLLRQCLAENLFLTIVSSAIGLAVAAWGTRVVTRYLPQGLPRVDEIAVDWRVAGFAIATAVILAIALGTISALGVRGQTPMATVRITRAGARTVRRSLVVAEMAMALVLLAGTGLFVKSLLNLYRVSPGFDPSNILTFTVTMPSTSYPEDPLIARFVERLRTDLASRPGIEAASGIFGLPLTHEFGAGSSFDRPERRTDPDNEPIAALRVATPDYFRAMRIPLESGREFSERDTIEAPGVAIINVAAARKYWPGEDPIGRQLRVHVGLTRTAQTRRVIVGVVNNVRYAALDAEPQAEVYIPHAQHPVDGLTMALRTTGDPRLAISEARAVLKELDPNLPMASIATMEEIVAESVAARRFSLMLLTGFAGVALLLAAIGIYGVLSYTVGQRTREIGVRMAMGAPRAHVLRLVVGEGLILVIAGLVVGLSATMAMTGVMRGLLYEVQPSDPSTLVVVGAVLACVALAASYLPARRAAAVDPVTALRSE